MAGGETTYYIYMPHTHTHTHTHTYKTHKKNNNGWC